MPTDASGLPQSNTMVLRPVSFVLMLKLCFWLGVALGAVASPWYAVTLAQSGEWLYALSAFILTPLANGLVVVLYGLVGYPVYLYLWKRRKFGMNLLVEHSQ